MSILTVLLDNILEYSKLGFILYDYGGGGEMSKSRVVELLKAETNVRLTTR